MNEHDSSRVIHLNRSSSVHVVGEVWNLLDELGLAPRARCGVRLDEDDTYTVGDYAIDERTDEFCPECVSRARKWRAVMPIVQGAFDTLVGAAALVALWLWFLGPYVGRHLIDYLTTATPGQLEHGFVIAGAGWIAWRMLMHLVDVIADATLGRKADR